MRNEHKFADKSSMASLKESACWNIEHLQRGVPGEHQVRHTRYAVTHTHEQQAVSRSLGAVLASAVVCPGAMRLSGAKEIAGPQEEPHNK